MYQSGNSYDSMLISLADYLAARSKAAGNPYSGKTKVGVVSLDSEYIKPSVTAFANRLKAKGLTLVKTVTVQKPTEQTTYATQEQELAGAGVQILVPTMDPISTSRIVAECSPATTQQPTPACPWVWSFANFAHDSETALALMKGSWINVEGLTAGCYYNAPQRDDTGKCAKMGQAHKEWVAAPNGGESDWNSKGSGGSAGYQVVHFWLKALKDAGADPTRERFRAALSSYQGYDDLVSSAITFRGSPNISHGAERTAALKAGGDQKFTMISDGLVAGY